MSLHHTVHRRALAVRALPALVAALLAAGCSAGATGAAAPSTARPTPSPTTTRTNQAAAPVTLSEASLTAPVPSRAYRIDGHPVVYLTFDDGPSAGGTEGMLGVLARHRARATFFLIGTNAARYPDLVRAEIAAGDSVGDHTWTHPHLRTLSRAAVADQLARTQALLRSLGAPSRCFRPPYGETDSTVLGVARSLHLHQYLWTTESKDWTGAPASTDLAKALAGLRPGAIIVFHDWVVRSQQVVDEFLTVAESRGYVAAALPC